MKVAAGALKRKRSQAHHQFVPTQADLHRTDRLHTTLSKGNPKDRHRHKRHLSSHAGIAGVITAAAFIEPISMGSQLQKSGDVKKLQQSLRVSKRNTRLSGVMSQSTKKLGHAVPPFTSLRSAMNTHAMTYSEKADARGRQSEIAAINPSHKLVFAREFKMKTVKSRLSSARKTALGISSGLRSKATKSLGGNQKQRISSHGIDGLMNVMQANSFAALSKTGEISPGNTSPVQNVLAHAVHRGILQKHPGGWVIKPIHWKSPGAMPVSQWTLTAPKQSGPLILTLIHMQNSWKVHLEVSSLGLAGALAENLGQVQNMTAASLPVSQVSIFLGMGQHAMGQGNSSGNSGSFGRPQDPSPPSRPWRHSPLSSPVLGRPLLSANTVVDYQA
ncbi:hypothetical protein [Sulfobacillus thermosulfidooxidans]|uniref:hypothetical protein n=1 Tax=Sulfobacillus thermosulfidooxidans TaxID=28034 RepID=UPI001111CC90|nr:hypothetical protein [Sulfobacillus thermosulfidooxidans]